MKRFVLATACLALFGFKDDGCGHETSDDVQRKQQERILSEGTSQIGMPAIKNFRERKLLKDILEMRDQDGLTTYTYVWSDMRGMWTFFCHSIGYGLPYATEFTNPSKIEWSSGKGLGVLPQADPNGLFAPSSAEGTWVMCKDPTGKDVRPVYIEPRIIVSPFELPDPTAKPEPVVAKALAAPVKASGKP